MFYFYGYDPNFCHEDCDNCVFKLECIHYTPLTDTESGENKTTEEYRLFVKELDDTRLLENFTERWRKKFGLPKREAEILVRACRIIGWPLKSCEQVIEKEGVLNLEKYVCVCLEDAIKEYVAENTERIGVEWLEEIIGVEQLEELDLDFLPTEPWFIDLIIHMLYKNFTGEVRLGSPQDDEEPEDINGQDFKELERMLKSLIILKDGRRAYELSCQIKEKLKRIEDPHQRRRWWKFLKQAWETRRKLEGLSVEEKMARYRELTGWTF